MLVTTAVVMVVGRTYQTRPKAPMPTGWRSEYLEMESATEKRMRERAETGGCRGRQGADCTSR